jgi:uncharacterized protein (DUF1330 family)
VSDAGGHIEPTPEQGAAFAGAAQAEGAVFMLNLLRFEALAKGVDVGISGAEAYGRYAAKTAPHLARVGAEIVWAGACGDALIGPPGREWDVAAVVRYPSRSAFLEMVSDPAYLEIARHRSAGLAESRLIPCAEALPLSAPE